MSKDEIIARLKAHADELRARGILHAAIFGSVARGDATSTSDVDVVVTLDPHCRIDGFTFAGIEHELSELLGCPVDLVAEPVKRPSLRLAIERDRAVAF